MNAKLSLVSTALIATVIGGVSGCAKFQQEAPAYSNRPHTITLTKSAKAKQNNSADKISDQQNYQTMKNVINPNVKPFNYQRGKRKMVIYKPDRLNRAVGSHIQLKENQTPTAKRSSYLTIRPSGWHNYKFTTNKNGRPYTTWLYNRGHLVGYQFCGLNQAPGNMITQTTYTNQGSLTGMNDKNTKGQLYYENMLRAWLVRHPKYSLDYSVTPIYKDNDLVPNKIRFRFVGYSDSGKKLTIHTHSNLAKIKNKVTTVTIKNNSPQAKIDYATGRAVVKNYQ